MALLECRNVSLGYEGKTILSDINFALEGGEYLCVVGENGAGKSTLIKGLLRLKKPMSGEILMGDGLRPREIGYLPQQTEAQRDFPASVSEVVLSGRLNSLGARPFYNRADKVDAHDKMRLMGIDGMQSKCYHDLSGGQQQRVLLARALCATRKMLILDEPVSGLDPIVTAELYGLIDKINKKLGITVIMVSHDIEAAVGYSSHILHLSHRQVFFGTTGDYLSTEEGRRFALGEEGKNA
ncbi:MAG: metal ABC transporter ATP-binding protein [Butyrivibrio sp.]|nr:metal ABC transporter ATP-binding protein [Butyrivibrio sp.]